MGFDILERDITKFECDAIINSVGVDSTIYGGICRSIIEASKGDDLKKIIDGVNDLYSVGDFFVTGSYGLPCRQIIHLITPYYDEDKKYLQYAECLRRILNECQLRGLYNVGIPSIGTMANKYDKEKTQKIIVDMCSAYCDLFEKMNITFILSPEGISLWNRNRISRERYNDMEYHDPKTLSKFKKGAKLFRETFNPFKPNAYNYNFFDYEGYIKPRESVTPKLDGVKTIGQYVERYIEAREVDIHYPEEKVVLRRIYNYLGCGRKGKETYAHAGATIYGDIKDKNEIDKKRMFVLVFALEMTLQEANDFLLYFGNCFSKEGVNKVDDLVQKLLKQQKYGIVEIENAFKKDGSPSILKK